MSQPKPKPKPSLSKITARGQTTLPQVVRETAGLSAGDWVAYEVKRDGVMLRKVTPDAGDAYLRGLEQTLSEWESDEDEAAWRGFKPFDVVVVPFPFSERLAVKRRPALVLSSARFNEAHRHYVLAMITSTREKWPSDVTLRNLRAAGLGKPCKVRLKLFTLDAALVQAQRGQLAARDIEAVRRALAKFLAIN